MAGSSESRSPRIPDHPLIPANDPPVLVDAAEIADFLDEARAAGAFAFDTEFIGEESYHPRLCVVQLATRDRVVLVDPLAGADLRPIWELIADPAVETIVHAGQQDLEPVVRLLDREPAAIFDTQVAAGFIGRPYPLGLAAIVQELVGVRLGKGFTFTRWDQRPLSASHRSYAADDVRYLLAVREGLRTMLQEVGHEEHVLAECAESTRAERYRFDPVSRVTRLAGGRSLDRRTLAMLHELVVWRDDLARAQDLPPRAFMKDDVLVRLARETPRSLEKLENVKGLPRPVIRDHGATLLELAERIKGRASDELPAAGAPDESPAERIAIDGLWAYICASCLGRGIDPSIVGSRREAAILWHRLARERMRLPETGFERGWRRELVGARVADLLAGEGSIALAWRDGRLLAVDQGASPSS